jgi:hypothetical protein
MERELQRRYIRISTAGETVRAFMPAPLPPHLPIDWTPERRSRFDEALVTLGRLDSVVRELTARKRNRLFSYSQYVDLMKQGTDPPDS